ncbi:MAG: M3 family oligoendopeptidase [Verrucomicrobia bacterium]|nr:MAG: M3 family oligoendopeptidase [Verrucomicrobiota bacterium]
MSLLPFKDLPVHTPRRFVPVAGDLGDWEQIQPLFDGLERSIASAHTPEALEQWLLDWGELSAALDEESSKRYIAMTCHTDSPEAEKAYLELVENLDPKSKPRQFKLEQLYLEHPSREKLSSSRYEVFDRSVRNHVELYREENVALETEEAKLGQQYQKLSGSLTVQFRGEEKTLTQMGRFLEETERVLRQEAWSLVANRRLEMKDQFEDIFDQLIELRQRMARNAGFDNYRDYAFKLRGRFDYNSEDCYHFHEAIAHEVIPLLKQLQNQRRLQLSLDALRPWDLAVDPLNQPPLRPFERVETMVERTQNIFDQLDPIASDGFKTLRQLALLDLANRKGKAPGGYQCTLAESRLPFIFMNAVGVQRDVETMLHEAGHAFHALATRNENLYAYRSAPIEFCEVASMTMELLGNEHIESFYSSAEARRARRDHLEGVVEVFPWIATVDAFQHWIYTHPGHTRFERASAWDQLICRFGGEVDWSGLDAARSHLWHRQLHIFLHPFYYVEYGIAQLGALQIWSNFKQDSVSALRNYHDGLTLGGSRPLPELFRTAGCQFDFSTATVRPLVQLLRQELEALQ